MSSSKTSISRKIADFIGLGIELVSLMFLIRLVVDTTNRIFMPFLPQFSSGLGLTITAFSWLLALRSLTGLAGPMIGIFADRYGRRPIMILALVIRGIGLFGLAFSTGWWSAVPLLMISLSTTAYLPVQKAYISDQVCYERRGRALAAVDASFSTAGMIGLPLVGWLMVHWGWQIPIFVLAVLSFFAAIFIAWRMPKTQTRSQNVENQHNSWQYFFLPHIFSSVIVTCLLIFIFILFMLFWALWLSEDFGLGPLEIGLIATSIGLAEFVGLLLAGLFIDRIGKRRGTLIGLIFSALLMGLLPFFRQTLLEIQIMLILTAVAIEFALTAAIPLFAEQDPNARATVFSLVAFGNTIGAGIAPPVTTSLWIWGGLMAIVVVGLGSSLLAFVLVWRFLHDHSDEITVSLG
jgi:predicted MFS family arabinose efflux permease